VGKSLLGRYLSKKCEENGWTYILIDDATALKDALILAKRYEPAVVFCEDIDRFAAERTDSANELLNTIDGVVGKDSKVICCLTTNHIERIQKDNQAILRPGRFDVVFSVTPPDDEAVERLIRYYSDGLLDASEDITAVGAILSGQIPAVIREAVERAKLSRIRRKDSMLSAGDLVTAAKSMSKHMALLEVRADEPTDAEVLHDKLGKATAKAMNGGLADVSLQMNAVKKNVTRLVNELT
jgi:SpoVK/Ycf46/Vps4 family AAA+-type ATPase